MRFVKFRRIRTAIFVSIVVVVLTAVVGAGIAFLQFYEDSTRRDAEDTSLRLTELISRNLESVLTSIQSYVSVSARSIMDAAQNPGPEAPLTEHMLVQQLIYSNTIIDRVLAVASSGASYYFDRNKGPSAQPERDELSSFVMARLERIRGWWGAPYWFVLPADADHVYFAIATFRYAIPEYSGTVAVGVPVSYFESQYAQYPAVGGGTFFVFNRLGEPVYGRASPLLPVAAAAVAGLPRDYSAGSLKTSVSPGAISTATRPSGQLLTFVTVVPKSNLFKRAAVIQRTLLATSAVSVVLAFLLAWALSNSITRDLRMLTTSARRISHGDLDHRLSMERRDEINDLTESFNSMIERLGATIDALSTEKARTREAEFRAVEAEYRALQASIDPHFLYNVLESINSLAKMHGQHNIAKIVASLSYLFRRSLADERRFITLDQEVEYLRNYLELQVAITGRQIESVFDVAPETSGCPVPKLLLQPLVENAVKHGLSESQDGVVSVVSYLNNGLHLIVSDNGRGPASGAVGEGEADVRAGNETGGFGIHSVRRRIEILYGDSAVFDFSGSAACGTRIEIVIPVDAVAESGRIK